MGNSMGFGLQLNTAGLGLNQGINVQQIVQTLTQAAEVPITQLQNEESFYQSQQSALNNTNTLLGNLQTDVQALQDPAGALEATTATSSNTAVVTAASTTGATAGAHTVTVTSLATTSAYDTNPLATGDTAINPGSFTIQVGSGSPATINVSSSNNNTTLNTLASYINSQNVGVTATVITDASGARLGIVSSTSGAPGDLTIANNTTSLTFNKTVTGTNSSINVDGVPLNTTSNVVTGAIPDVTLTLNGASSSPVSVTIGADTQTASTAINNFVSDYNAVIKAMNTQFTYTQGASSQPPLFADASLQALQQLLYNDVNYSISGNSGYNTLASLGVTVQQDGTLSVDSATLDSALSSNAAAVENFFQQSAGVNGFAVNFANSLINLTSPASGPTYLDLQGVGQNIQDLQSQISTFQANVNQQAQLWLKEYAQVNSLLQTLPLQLEQLNAELGNINTSLSSSSSPSTASAPSSSSGL